MTKDQLIAFENDIAAIYETGAIKGPVHLSGGNETQLIEIFKEIRPTDWVFSNWRSHYHALLHGIPPEKVKAEILAGRSISLQFPKHRFYTSAIVAGILPIAVGVAMAIKRRGGNEKVWCFLGDMTAETGIFHECEKYSSTPLNHMPIKFIIEDNGISVKTPTQQSWGSLRGLVISIPFGPVRYSYTHTWPHSGIGKRIDF